VSVQLQPEAVLYLCVLAAWFGIRTPYALGARRNRRALHLDGGSDRPLLLVALLSMVLVPLVSLFTPWLAAADYPLPRWCLGVGFVLFAASLLILWRAHADLRRNFSVRIEIRESHNLVTDGIYAAVRHPMYTHHLLFSLAQLLVLRNGVVAGFAIASCLLVYFVRIPAEEKALADEFGESYRSYIRWTGLVLPRLTWFAASRSE
jgi:protein-S-isoprenylcysteine O-methyltransferase Ste14